MITRESGYPQGTILLQYGERPLDGGWGRTPARGPTHPHHIPRPYYIRAEPTSSYIVGTGVGWTWWVAPCGRPSSSLIVQDVPDGEAPCGRPSSSLIVQDVPDGEAPCGRPSSHIDALYLNRIVPCERPSPNCASLSTFLATAQEGSPHD